MSMTPERLAEIRALEEDTTPGPWVVDDDGTSVWTEGETVLGGTIHRADDGYARGDYDPAADAKFIAEAKQFVPELLDEVARLRRGR